ncbi:MAG: VOC family protein [Trebonia sp.]
MPDSPSERPEDLRFISGVILVSRQPERVAQFYRDVLGLPLAEERHGETQLHWGCELGDVHFAIHPAADYPDDPTVGPGPVKLAFMVFDLSRMVAWLDGCGVPLCYPPADLGEQSQITAVRDPDGNLVELTQLGPDWLGHLKAHRAQGHDLVSAWGARLAELVSRAPDRPQAVPLIRVGRLVTGHRAVQLTEPHQPGSSLGLWHSKIARGRERRSAR